VRTVCTGCIEGAARSEQGEGGLLRILGVVEERERERED